MKRIVLEYIGTKVIDSKVQYHYRHFVINPSKPKKGGKKRPAKEYFFDQILFPYHVPGSFVIGNKKGSQVLEPYTRPSGERIQTFSLYLPKAKSRRKVKLYEKVFVLKDKKGLYALTDPLTDQILLTKELGLLRVWDIHYPLMEDYFVQSHRYHSRFTIHYLSKPEIKLLNT